VKGFLRKKEKMFQKGELFFDDDGFDRAGLGCLFALRLQGLGDGFHLCYRHIPIHFKDLRTDLHARFIATQVSLSTRTFIFLPFLLKELPHP